jgi:hypothetical protein
MLELLWAILNFGISIFFLIICFKSTKLVREKLGMFAAIVFVLGLLSFLAGPEEKSIIDKNFGDSNQPQATKAFNGDGGSFSTTLKLEDNLATSISLYVIAGIKDGKISVQSANCYRDGFVSGSTWDVKSLTILKNHDNIFTYDISAIKKWKILGIPFFSENQEFNGEIKLEDKHI